MKIELDFKEGCHPEEGFGWFFVVVWSRDDVPRAGIEMAWYNRSANPKWWTGTPGNTNPMCFAKITHYANIPGNLQGLEPPLRFDKDDHPNLYAVDVNGYELHEKLTNKKREGGSK